MGNAAEYVSRTRIGAYFHSLRESRKLILLIVAVALLLDNMLLTTVGKSYKSKTSAKTPKTRVTEVKFRFIKIPKKLGEVGFQKLLVLSRKQLLFWSAH